MADNWLASHGPVYPSNLGMRVDDVVPAFSDDNLSQISVLVNLVLKGPRSKTKSIERGFFVNLLRAVT